MTNKKLKEKIKWFNYSWTVIANKPKYGPKVSINKL